MAVGSLPHAALITAVDNKDPLSSSNMKDHSNISALWNNKHTYVPEQGKRGVTDNSQGKLIHLLIFSTFTIL